MDTRLNFYSFTRETLGAWFEDQGQPRYRADQLFANVYQRSMPDFEAMTDLPKELRKKLQGLIDLSPLMERSRRESPDGSATKFLWGLTDQNEIEAVLMTADYGETICFSTQVVCAFRCSFCITGKMGRIRFGCWNASNWLFLRLWIKNNGKQNLPGHQSSHPK